MTETEREHHIKHFKRLMEGAFSAGNSYEARFYCRVMSGLVRGRSAAQVELMEAQINVGTSGRSRVLPSQDSPTPLTMTVE